MSSASPSPGPSTALTSRHAQTAVDKQRAQLDKLLKDPTKAAYVPLPPKEKTIRAPREMMKNVQGSSAGAGSGEFHVYKASRRREFERLKMMDEQSKKEVEEREFAQKKREWDEQAEAKTSKNRAKRQKKKERAKTKGGEQDGVETSRGISTDAPLKKRRLVNGQEVLFRRPDADSDEEGDGVGLPLLVPDTSSVPFESNPSGVPVVDVPRITIHEDD